MKPQNVLRSLALTGMFFSTNTIPGSAQGCEGNPANGEVVLQAPAPPDSSTKTSASAPPDKGGLMILKDWEFSGGQLTLPFKIRPNHDNHSFRLTTDVTIGGYIGAGKVLSKKHNYRLMIPLTAGLTFINLDNANTSLDLSEAGADVVPGISWSTGLILQLGDCNVGLVVGKDYASNVGDDWEYNGKWWWSFAIGYAFIGGGE